MAMSQIDALRAVGRLLDVEAATDIELVRDPQALTVWWQAGDGTRQWHAFNEDELLRLCAESRAQRSQPPPARGLPLAELLRTLGQDEERSGAEWLGIVQAPDGFLVTEAVGGEISHRHCPTPQLLALSRRFRARRGHL